MLCLLSTSAFVRRKPQMGAQCSACCGPQLKDQQPWVAEGVQLLDPELNAPDPEHNSARRCADVSIGRGMPGSEVALSPARMCPGFAVICRMSVGSRALVLYVNRDKPPTTQRGSTRPRGPPAHCAAFIHVAATSNQAYIRTPSFAHNGCRSQSAKLLASRVCKFHLTSHKMHPHGCRLGTSAISKPAKDLHRALPNGWGPVVPKG